MEEEGWKALVPPITPLHTVTLKPKRVLAYTAGALQTALVTMTTTLIPQACYHDYNTGVAWVLPPSLLCGHGLVLPPSPLCGRGLVLPPSPVCALTGVLFAYKEMAGHLINGGTETLNAILRKGALLDVADRRRGNQVGVDGVLPVLLPCAL